MWRVGRAGIWEDTWRLFERHTLAGVGLGGYWIAVRATHGGSGELVPRQAHNDYLELLASAGVVGAALLLWFLFVFVRLARERLRAGAPFTRAVALGALAGLFGVAVHSLFDFGLHARRTPSSRPRSSRSPPRASRLNPPARVQKTSRREY